MDLMKDIFYAAFGLIATWGNSLTPRNGFTFQTTNNPTFYGRGWRELSHIFGYGRISVTSIGRFCERLPGHQSQFWMAVFIGAWLCERL